MPAIPGGSRAKRAYLRVEKTDITGRKYIGQNEVIPSFGMFSAREAERELQKAADSSEEKVVDWSVEPYHAREVPEMYGNPRRSSVTGTQWSGFYGSTWPPESPTIRNINARREKGKPESGVAESDQTQG